MSSLKKSSMCPIPVSIENESSYDKAFWRRFDSNFEKSAHAMILSREFREINGIPFRVLHAVRDNEPRSSAKIYAEVACTPGNGNIYEILLRKTGTDPGSDHDLSEIFASFAFVNPPQIAWYQPLLHYIDNLAGMPLLAIALGFGAYFFIVRRDPNVPLKRKANAAAISFSLLMLNGMWIAGLGSAVGIISILLIAPIALAQQRLNKDFKAEVAAGRVTAPTRRQLSFRFWLLCGSGFLGLLMADAAFLLQQLPAWLIVFSNVFTIAMFGGILWSQRRRFFPPNEQQPGPNP